MPWLVPGHVLGVQLSLFYHGVAPAAQLGVAVGPMTGEHRTPQEKLHGDTPLPLFPRVPLRARRLDGKG